MNKYVISGGTIITLGAENRVIEDGALCVEDGRIADIGTREELRARCDCPEAIDATGKVVLPGFICAHHHLYSSMARGFAPPGDPAQSFAEILERLWWKLDRALTADDVKQSALVALVECIRNGTTTILDHHASPACRAGSLDQLADAVLQSGIRAALCYEVSDRNEPGAGIAETERYLTRLARERSDQLAGMVGIHASFTVSDATLGRCRELAEKHDVGFHLHVAEGPEDPEDALARYNMRTVERLVDRGICGDKTLYIHCINVNDEELARIKDSGTMVVHNPESNMNNAVGAAPVLDMLRRGILVGLGTDGMSSDMPAQMRAAYLLQRLAERDPRVAFVEAPTLLLWNNARIANRLFPVKLGVLEPGAAADIAILDYAAPTRLDAQTFLGHFTFGMVDATVDTTIAGGRILMQDKQIKTLDVEQIAARSRALAEKLWERIRAL